MNTNEIVLPKVKEFDNSINEAFMTLKKGMNYINY